MFSTPSKLEDERDKRRETIAGRTDDNGKHMACGF